MLLDFIEKSRPGLRVLRLGALVRSSRVQQLLSQLGTVEELYLELGPDLEPGVSLRGCLPRLARLEVLGLYMPQQQQQLPSVRLVADLVGGAAESLRELLFRGRTPARLPAAVLAELRHCRGLQALRCSLDVLGLLAALPRLRSLELWSETPADDLEAEAWVELLASSAESLRQCGVLADLRKLSFCLDWWRPALPGHLVQLKPQVLNALLAVACEVTSLKIKLKKGWMDTNTAPIASSVFEGMPRLAAVEYSPCSAATLASLAGLPALRRVTVDIHCWDYSQYMAPGCSQCEGAAADFRSRRPDVKSSFKVHGRLVRLSHHGSEA